MPLMMILINIIREDFSDAPTMNEAREELLHMCQKPEEQMLCLHLQVRAHAPEVVRYQGS